MRCRSRCVMPMAVIVQKGTTSLKTCDRPLLPHDQVRFR